MWICRCGTETRTRTTQCPSCKGPEDVEGGSWLPLVLIGMGFLVGFAIMLIDDAYQIPALKHYGGIVFFLLFGFGGLSMARSDQKSGLGGDELDFPIRKEESPIGFWLYTGTMYAGGIFLIVCAVISFLFPSTFSLGH